ncbi:hypothetical protein KBA73_00340 [Patescibacteria group bacterium]|nr:hypothetical protein [Patescibacteria group bacterium]
MSHRSFALTLPRPHVAFGIPVSTSRKIGVRGLEKGLGLVIVGGATVACLIFYVFLVNRTSSQSFTLRTLDKQVERLKESTSDLNEQVVRLKAIQSIEDRVKGLGYIPIDQYEYIDLPRQTYALK